MWAKEFKDYPTDTPLKKTTVEPGHGIVGCEMHERFGWGTLFHEAATKKKKSGFFRTLLEQFFKKK